MQADIGFPSGHATDSSAFWGYIGLEGYRSKGSLLYPVVSTIIFVLVGYSRVFLGVHTWFDVIGGLVFGILYGICDI
ncbi:MAG: phosphatase PAP2 family protein [Candidatus Njordarchaeia archaeon]